MATTRHWQSGPGGSCGSCGSSDPFWPCTAMRLAIVKLALHNVYQEALKCDSTMSRSIRAIIDESRREPKNDKCRRCGVAIDPGRVLCPGCGFVDEG